MQCYFIFFLNDHKIIFRRYLAKEFSCTMHMLCLLSSVADYKQELLILFSFEKNSSIKAKFVKCTTNNFTVNRLFHLNCECLPLLHHAMDLYFFFWSNGTCLTTLLQRRPTIICIPMHCLAIKSKYEGNLHI